MDGEPTREQRREEIGLALEELLQTGQLVLTYTRGAGAVWMPPANGERKPVRSAGLQRLSRLAVEAAAPAARWAAGTLFKDAMPRFLRMRARETEPTTQAREREHQKRLTEFFGRYTLGECADPELLRDYQDQRAAKAGPSAVNHELGLLRMLLRRANLWQAVADDYRQVRERPSTRGRALTPAQERELFRAAQAKPEWFVAYQVARILSNTVLNPSEMFALRLSDVDLENRLVLVRRGKTRYRPREVPLNHAAMRAARALVKRAKETCGATEREHFLLPYRGRVGVCWDPTQPQRACRTAWRALTRSIGQRGLRLKDLRHHGITVMDERGVSELTITKIAGQRPNSRVLERYSHPRMKAKRQAVAMLEKGRTR